MRPTNQRVRRSWRETHENSSALRQTRLPSLSYIRRHSHLPSLVAKWSGCGGWRAVCEPASAGIVCGGCRKALP